MPAEIEELREAIRLAKEFAAVSEQKRREAEEDAIKQRGANSELLEKLLKEQRASIEMDYIDLKNQLANAQGQCSALDSELARLKQESAGNMVKLQEIPAIQTQLSQVIVAHLIHVHAACGSFCIL